MGIFGNFKIPEIINNVSVFDFDVLCDQDD